MKLSENGECFFLKEGENLSCYYPPPPPLTLRRCGYQSWTICTASGH